MRRILDKLLVPGLLLLWAGCSSGSSDGTSPGASSFRIKLCSLGCNSGTCAVNEIATNQSIVLTFNDEVDPASVSFTTISLVEQSNGTSPQGEFIVDGPRVIFRPALTETTGGILFGFADGSIYELSIKSAPESNVVRSVIGRPNTTALTCQIQTKGIIDLVPGRPSVSVKPNAGNPPSSNPFNVVFTFNDLMQKAQLVDELTGTSPTLSVVVVDQTSVPAVEISIPGVFSASFDRDKLTTKVTFVPLAPYPGGKNGKRMLRLDVAAQIADLAGNTLLNPGSFTVPLPNESSTPGLFLEDFETLAQLDPAGSADGLWGTLPPGTFDRVLDSGLDPVSGGHKGGSSGFLGVFAPEDDFVFDTDFTVVTDITGQTFTITDGVFPYDEIHIPDGVRVSAIGTNPLRLFSRGEVVIEGVLDLSGDDAPANFGKYYPVDEGERVPTESTDRISESEADGGAPGIGQLGAANGGRGGASVYLFQGPNPKPDYYDEDNPDNFASGTPDPARYTSYITRDQIHGRNGGGVGGVAPLGRPIFKPEEIINDLANGSGMGSFAWPLYTNQVPDPADPASMTPNSDFDIKSHFDSSISSFTHHAIHRARGGGGGGYWSDGQQGGFFDIASTDPLGNPLFAPVIDPPNFVYEYNSFLEWDFVVSLSGGTPSVADGGGGAFDPSLWPGIETLDPDSGLLFGGSGGGGAGSSQHGSWDDTFSGEIDTQRGGDGAGGGSGGGSVQLQAGGRLSVTGELTVEGGQGGDSEFMVAIPFGDPNAILVGQPGDGGGGGGSGGSALLQIGGDIQVVPDGISLEGGRGGLGSAGNHGGAGGSGLARFETATGTETLALLQSWVTPDEAVDLAPIGQAGVPNRIKSDLSIPGTTADLGLINGNSSGVRSLWYRPAGTLSVLSFQSYSILCEYDDGSGPTVLIYSDNGVFTQPGATPIWIGFQTGWAPPGATEPDPATVSEWIIPGFQGTAGGLPELRSNLANRVRYQIVFDQDVVQGLIGANPNASFRVLQVELTWEGE